MVQDIIIFGGSGFIGTHLTRYLIDRSEIGEIIIADIKKPKISNKKVIFIKTDIREKISADNFSGEFSHIINLSAVHQTPGHKDHEYFETNIKGAHNICDFAVTKKIPNIIFTSSISIYGTGEDEKKESSIPMPNIPYGISKIIAEHVHKCWFKDAEKNRKLVTIRPAVVFGKGEKGNFTRIAHALRNKIFIYPGRKDTIKSCCYVKDLCRFIILQMKKEQGYYLNNFCYPEKITIEDITQAFHESLGYSKPFLIIPKFMVNGGAFILGALGTVLPLLKKYGFDPARVSKLTKSTNISSKKLIRDNFKFKYKLKEALLDWEKDCKSRKLF